MSCILLQGQQKEQLYFSDVAKTEEQWKPYLKDLVSMAGLHKARDFAACPETHSWLMCLLA